MKVSRIRTAIMVAFLIMSIGFSSPVQGAQKAQGGGRIWYVKHNGTSRLCNSWTNACTLQNALEDASPGDEIWVAAGTHKPTNGTDRDITFQLAEGVDVYGGFPAAGGTWEQRNWQKNPTNLNGNIGSSGDHSDNSKNIVSAENLSEIIVLDGFTIIGGNGTFGAGMYVNQSNLVLRNLIFSNNYVTFDGGGLFLASSNVEITNVTFEMNTAARSGGGVYHIFCESTLSNVSFEANLAVDGGGMYLEFPSLLTNVTFSQNEATNNGGGIYVDSAGRATLNEVTFYENIAHNFGGGMYNKNNWTNTLNSVTFTRNNATSGGGIYYNESEGVLTDVTFTGNSAVYGGGLFNYISDTELSKITFLGNSASSGGGVYNDQSNSKFTNVTFTGNSAVYGGGLFNYISDTELSKITFLGNSASSGGGVYNEQSNSKFTNVTFSENVSTFGGGMYNTFSSPFLRNITFYGNSATSFGGGIMSNNSHPTLINNIFWANTTNQITNGAGSTTTISYSIIQGGYPGTGNSSVDPKLQPLASNGGFTQTHALGAGSSAIDTGDPTSCAVIDQRGYPRPVDGDGDGLAVCDMGAYEADFSGFRLFLPLILK